VKVAARHDQLWVVSVRCHRCRNQQTFWFARSDSNQDESLGDLSREEQERFSVMDPLTWDAVLDIHEFLAEFNGDFKEFFTP